MKPTVLLVDDDPIQRSALQRTLSDPAYAIVEASGSEEAFEVLATTPSVSVVVSDQHMRGMLGSAFLGTVANQYPRVARVLLTADTSTDTFDAAVTDGNARRVIYKPWNGDQIRAVIWECLGLPRRGADPRAGRYDGPGTLRIRRTHR